MKTAEVKTVGQLKALIRSNMEVPELHEHATNLLAPRTTGSTTTLALADVPDDVVIEPVVHSCVCGPSKLYKFTYAMGGVLGAIPYRAALELGAVGLRIGQHGHEWYVTVPQGFQQPTTDEIYVIVGPHTCRDSVQLASVVYTWHPGAPLRPYDSTDPLHADTGVKVVVRDYPRATLTNGVRVANFSSPHSFVFTDGTGLAPCSDERARALLLDTTEVVVQVHKKWTDVKPTFALSAAVCNAVAAVEADLDVDIVLVPLPIMEALKAAGIVSKKCRVCRVADRVTKAIHIDRFCV